MTDLARLGFSADTSALKTAKAALDQLVPAAEKTAKSVNAVSAAAAGITGPVKGAAAGILSFDGAVKQAAAGAGSLRGAALMSGTALGTVQGAAVSAANGINLVGLAANRTGIMMAAADAHVLAYRSHIASIPAAANTAKSGLDRLGAAANDNINRLQSTPGNIAAQFQDIGVTAAAGMNPLLIALQQGTQLSSAMAGGIGPLLAGFAQLFSLTTILTIGLVGLAVAGLQMIDWMSVGKSVLNGLADALEVAAPYAVALGAAMLLAFAPRIITAIYATAAAMTSALIPALIRATVALVAFAFVNPWTAFVLGVGIVIAALYGLNQVFDGVFADILSVVTKAINYIIAFFVGGFNAIKATWSQLPGAMGDVAIQAANNVIRAVELMVNGSIARINLLTSMLPFDLGKGLQMGNVSLGQLENSNAGKALAVAREWGVQTGKAAGKAARGEYTSEMISGIKSMAGDAADWLRGMADKMGKKKGKDAKNAADGGDDTKPKAEKTIAEKFDDLLGDASKQARALDQAGAQIGVYGEALAQLKYQQDLFNKAQDAGIPLIDKATGKLNAYGEQLLKISQELAKQDEANRNAQFIEDMALKLESQQRALNQSRGEIGLTGAALAAYRFEQELLNDAISKHIELTQPELDAIKAAAKGYGEQTEAIRKAKEQLEFARDTTKDFFMNFFDGLREGESLIKSFGDAVLDTLNRIIDKLLNTFLDNFLNNLGGSFGGLFKTNTGTVSTPPISPNANGNAFGKGGSRLGIMGEKGDEAILPLRRGPDGSLGVQAGAAGRGGGTVVNAPVHVQNDYHLDGAIAPETILKMIQQGGAKTEQEVKRSLMATLAQLQRDGAVV